MSVYADDNTLRDEGTREIIGAFSGHWAACAAMIRMRDPGFVSLGGDKAEDLAEEARIRSENGG